MANGITWTNSLTAGLGQFAAEVDADTVDALSEGAELIIADAETRTPKESGHLAGTGQVKSDRGGRRTVGLWFAGPYARWIHEHLHFKHPRGGQAKFLETAMLTKGHEALHAAGIRLWRGRG